MADLPAPLPAVASLRSPPLNSARPRRSARSGKSARSLRGVVALALAPTVFAGCSPTIGQSDPVQGDGQQELTHIEGLGRISFPNSGADAAQSAFLRGVLLMHSFEYGPAAEAFREAQEIDPDFALAYWGEAMSYNHPIWDQKDTEAARVALGRYAPTAAERLERAPSEREGAYLAAVEALYMDGEKAKLDTIYAQAMESLATRYPDDYEAQAFYALSILGLSQGNRDVPSYMRAGAMALGLAERNPDHPGAAHYVIHAFDDPTHAPIGLRAAHAYSEIAPRAAHAQHMTTHIFLALGMWDDVVAANERADGVVDRARDSGGQPPTSCGHYNEWLGYGYQQQGRYDDAEALVNACLEQTGPSQSAVLMRGLYLADSRDGTGALAQVRPDWADVAGQPRMLLEFGNGLAAHARSDLAGASAALAAMAAATAPGAGPASPYVPIVLKTMEAIKLSLEGRMEDALAVATEAADLEASLPIDFGPPLSIKPPRELQGELALVAGDAEAALAAFEMALARTPKRVLSLAGQARAAAAIGDTRTAQVAYTTLSRVLDRGDAGLPLRQEAQEYLTATEHD